MPKFFLHSPIPVRSAVHNYTQKARPKHRIDILKTQNDLFLLLTELWSVSEGYRQFHKMYIYLNFRVVWVTASKY